jgi:hypothetical protein
MGGGGRRLQLTPATRLASTVQAGLTPSKISQSTDSTPSVASEADTTPAANNASAIEPAGTPVKPAREIKIPATVGGFTFRSKGVPGGFKRLSDMHALNYHKKAEHGTPAPASLLNTPMEICTEDPFMNASRRVARERTPIKAVKRKAEDELEKEGEEEEKKDDEGGARKKLKFEASGEKEEEGKKVEGMEGMQTPAKKTKGGIFSRGKAILMKSRLHMLATPKKRVERPEGEKKKEDGRIRWI